MEKTNLFNTSQNRFAAVALACVIALFATASFVTSPAAQAAVAARGTQPTSDGNAPIDCTGGCDITPCKGTVCVAWHCDADTGCNLTGSYHRQLPQKMRLAGSAAQNPAATAASRVPAYRYVSLCPADSADCSVYEVTTAAAKKVGHYRNVNATRKHS